MTTRNKVLEILNDKTLKYKNLYNLYTTIARKLNVDRDVVEEIITKLIKSGEVLESKNGKLATLQTLKLKKGEVANKSRDYLFVKIPGQARDYFIPSDKTKGAISGDIVLVRATGGNNEAEVVKIVEKVNRQVVGIVKKDEIGTFVEADRFTKPIYIQEKDLNGAAVNDLVVTEITYQPSSKDGLQGRVSEILGRADDKAILEQAIIKDFNLPTEYSKEALAQCEYIPEKISEDDKKGRLDLTGETIFTIDGADARDLDDAVSIKKLEDGTYELGVHIADVGNYVTLGSPLDQDAFERGTSVYFPDNVIPMLPKKLSNGICSLNPNVERLALSVIMKIDSTGHVVSHEIKESVIKSCQRFTYDEIFAIMNGDKEMCEKYAHLKDDVLLMQELSNIIKADRERRGSLNFDLPEATFKLNEQGEVLEINPRVQNEAHNLIERFMVICNETVAKHFDDLNVPFVYRVHEKPSPESVQKVLMFMEGLGVNRILPPKKIDPTFYQQLISLFEGTEQARVLDKVILMSMKKARYQEEDLGHFGLASENYCHFTSPIRRYPDLCIHRIIKECLHKGVDRKNLYELEDFVTEASFQASKTERRADDAERAVDDLKKAEYMSKQIGKEFEGVISGVTNFGVFVQLPNTVEGLIKLENLPKDDYVFIDTQQKLAGRKKTYCLGDPIKVKVAAANVFTRKIDFEECQEKNKNKIVKKTENLCK